MSAATIHQPMTEGEVAQLSINTIRTLCMDAVQKANSGHPGTPMGMAPVAYCLWQNFLRFDPSHPIWPNRDRFVLSAGHASTLLYAMLHLTGVKAVNPKYQNQEGATSLQSETRGCACSSESPLSNKQIIQHVELLVCLPRIGGIGTKHSGCHLRWVEIPR